MKKWLLAIALCCIAIGVYFFLSAKSSTQKTLVARAKIVAANRVFMDTARWAQWWPPSIPYRVNGLYYNEVRLSLRGDQPVSLRIAQLNPDTVLLGWEGELPKEARYSMDTVLRAFRAFVEDVRNIYGVDFQRTMSRDSTLITLTSVIAEYPSTDFIYSRIDSLRAYANAQGANAINYPMMNVTRLDDHQWKVMIALSLDRTLAGKGRIVIKRFVPYKMIEGEVHGGDHRVQQAMRELYNFRDDYRLSIMALPFDLLITDRRQEPDSTRWVTRVCAPVS